MQCRIKSFLIVILLAAVPGCVWESGAAKPSPSPIPAAPLPAEGERIEKPINVSFSTYSLDWPVGWLWIDPDERNVRTPHNVKKSVLSLTVPTGKDLAGEYRNAPRYLKAVTGDFEIETRVSALPKENFQAAGLLIYCNEDNYIRLERSFAGPDGGEGVSLRVRRGEAVEQLALADAHAHLTDLKLSRHGSTFSAYLRNSEVDQWLRVGELAANFSPTVLIGLAAYNTAEPFTAEFAYIKLVPVK